MIKSEKIGIKLLSGVMALAMLFGVGSVATGCSKKDPADIKMEDKIQQVVEENNSAKSQLVEKIDQLYQEVMHTEKQDLINKVKEVKKRIDNSEIFADERALQEENEQLKKQELPEKNVFNGQALLNDFDNISSKIESYEFEKQQNDRLQTLVFENKKCVFIISGTQAVVKLAESGQAFRVQGIVEKDSLNGSEPTQIASALSHDAMCFMASDAGNYRAYGIIEGKTKKVFTTDKQNISSSSQKSSIFANNNVAFVENFVNDLKTFANTAGQISYSKYNGFTAKTDSKELNFKQNDKNILENVFMSETDKQSGVTYNTIANYESISQQEFDKMYSDIQKEIQKLEEKAASQQDV